MMVALVCSSASPNTLKETTRADDEETPILYSEPHVLVTHSGQVP